MSQFATGISLKKSRGTKETFLSAMASGYSFVHNFVSKWSCQHQPLCSDRFKVLQYLHSVILHSLKVLDDDGEVREPFHNL